MKTWLYGGATVGSLVGAGVGSIWGGALGFWSLALGFAGTLIGFYAGYKVGKVMGE